MNVFLGRVGQGLFFLFLFFLVYGVNARADDTQKEENSDPKIKNISISPGGRENIKVVKNSEGKEIFIRRIGIDDRLRLEIHNLQTLIKAKKDCPTQSDCKKNIVLYFNGMKISEASTINLEDNTIDFYLKYDSKNSEVRQNWTRLLGAPVPNFTNDPLKPGFFAREAKIAVGLDDGTKWIRFENPKIKATVKDDSGDLREKELNLYVLLEQVNPFKFWIFIAFLLLIGIFIRVYQPLHGALKEALSDIGPKPQSGAKPWSLARCQMAFWLVLVTVSFVSIWVTTGALDGISESALALIGIGTGAALGSVAIDISGDSQSKRNELDQKLLEMQVEAQDIEQELQQNQALTTDQRKYKQRLLDALHYNQVQIKEKILRIIENNPSQGPWKDILSDPDGNAALHRIQIVIWTLILGIIYVYSVWETLAMPEFNATLLALQGLSAGAYLGFKIPDKKS